MDILNVKTNQQTEFIDISNEIQKWVSKEKITDGIITVFVPHTTAGITINEHADPDVKRDILYELNKIIPFQDNYHHMEGNSAAHIKASLIGSSVQLIVEDKSLKMGTWQGVFFCEFDGPRSRKVWIKSSGNV